MSFQTVLETALFQRVITPEMKALIEMSVDKRDLNEQEINCLALLTSQLEAGEILVMPV
ncbi:hypothetical protein Lepto7376_2025 [[Leptolyngbya] sp. PCC 7376]|uniref:hypothetical protein n=1 Tax=[Leptolyngbya] sp. PCC 7376 TaxID=111781 RepID=UPI00029F48CB|nr:hypothetical protein [[Leptolyngbya] sp. PCC 7376]AFY38327.1 hypothetical protein Lepto7376_2025 [[Leptolyngbya] sp. PCC 7376]